MIRLQVEVSLLLFVPPKSTQLLVVANGPGQLLTVWITIVCLAIIISFECVS